MKKKHNRTLSPARKRQRDINFFQRRKIATRQTTYVQLSPTLPPHLWNDITAWTFKPWLCTKSINSLYADQLYIWGPSLSTIPHQTSNITPSTPALLRAMRLAFKALRLFRVLFMFTLSNGNITNTGTPPLVPLLIGVSRNGYSCHNAAASCSCCCHDDFSTRMDSLPPISAATKELSRWSMIREWPFPAAASCCCWGFRLHQSSADGGANPREEEDEAALLASEENTATQPPSCRCNCCCWSLLPRRCQLFCRTKLLLLLLQEASVCCCCCDEEHSNPRPARCETPKAATALLLKQAIVVIILSLFLSFSFSSFPTTKSTYHHQNTMYTYMIDYQTRKERRRRKLALLCMYTKEKKALCTRADKPTQVCTTNYTHFVRHKFKSLGPIESREREKLSEREEVERCVLLLCFVVW